MKVLVYGAGPLGSLFASRLVEGGHDVNVLARGRRLEQLRQDGIVLQDSMTGEKTVTEVKTVERLEPDDYYELIMVVMRYNQVLDILPVLGANRATKNILFMMNNVSGPDTIIDAVGADRAILGFPLPGGTREGNVMKIMRLNSKFRWTIPLGDADGCIRQRTVMIARLLGELRGYRTEIRNDMDAWLKYHAAILVPGIAAALLACATDPDRFVGTPDALIMAVRAMKESFSALKKCGYPETPRIIKLLRWTPEPLLVAALVFVTKMFRSDMETGAVGHTRAARDELMMLTDNLRRLWKENNIETPYVDQLYKYFDPVVLPIEKGSKGIKMNWKELIFPLVFTTVALQQVYYLLKPLIKRKKRMCVCKCSV